MTTLPCIVCRKSLEYVWRHVSDEFEEQGKNQPADGLAFYTTGNYGSEVFDSINGRRFITINVCDDCLIKTASAGMVATGDATANEPELEPWLGPTEGDD